MRLRESQKGMTAIGWVLALMVGGLIALGGIKLLPVYMKSYQISSVMKSVTTDQEVYEPPEVRRALSRQMQVNEIRVVKVEDFSIEKVDGRRMLVIAYEERIPFLANIDFMVSFEKQQPFRGE